MIYNISFDQFQRYRNTQLVIENIRNKDEKMKILEVGANEHKNLERFLPNDDIIYLDIVIPKEYINSVNYIQGDATDMSFEDDTFDIVVAMDVYEHIPSERRELFISELNRVCKRAFIISAPFYSDEVIVAENSCNNTFKMLFGVDYIWLYEHKELEIPSFEETISYLEKQRIQHEFFSHGSIELWQRILNIHFLAEFDGELRKKRAIIDDYYNRILFQADYTDRSYRKFIVGKKIRKELTDFSEKLIPITYDAKLEELENDFYTAVNQIFTERLTEKESKYAVMYIDVGSGFSAEEKIVFSPERQGKSSLYKSSVTIPADTKSVRFDPVEGKYCILKNLNIYADGRLQEYTGQNGFQRSGLDFFLNYDPQIVVELDASATNIEISYEKFVFDLRDEILHGAIAVLKDTCLKAAELEGLLKVQEQQMKEIHEELETTQDYLMIKQDEVEITQGQLEITQGQLETTQGQLETTQGQLETTQGQLATIQDRLENVQIQLSVVNSSYAAISNSTFWKLTKPMRSIVGGTKKVLRTIPIIRLPYLALRVWKYEGFKAVIARIRSKISEEDANSIKCILSYQDAKLQSNKKFDKNVKFSIVVPLYNTPADFLSEMIESVRSQTYANWELCLADGSDNEHKNVKRICKKMMRKDKRIKYKKLKKNLGISENTNACLEMATGDYIGLFDHDDLLHPSALYYYMHEICDKNADFIYCDEQTFEDRFDNATVINYKPDFAIDSLRGNNYICHFSVFKRTMLEQVGMFRKEFDGSQDYDLILRLVEQAKEIVHVPRVLYYWRAHQNSVASDISAKTYALDAAKNAIKEHLERSGLEGEVLDAKALSWYRIKYAIKGEPKVSILIPNKDSKEILKRCIDSIRTKTTYSNYEIIIVENNSETEEILEYYDELEKDTCIRVVKWEHEFNYSKINNFGYSYCQGEYVILLNNDIEVITPEWIEEMLMYVQREEVAAAGAMLYYPNDTIQHAGVIMGIGGVAGHSHKYLDRNELGYMGRLQYAQNLSAVTAACMMVKRSVYGEINGLDECYAVAFNDIDFCMRIREAGYLICWTPFAELYHHESITRGHEDTLEKQERFRGEVERFQARWKRELEEGDPYYNKNLSLVFEDFRFKEV